jgi:hypothetical protein
MRQEDDGGQREERDDGARDFSRQPDDAARGADAGGRTGHPDDGGEAEQKARGETGPGEERRHERHHAASRARAQGPGLRRWASLW